MRAAGRSVTVDRVLKGQLCAGCGLCASVSGGALQMRAAPPGYARPEQVAPVGEAAERKIAAACPGAVAAAWDKAPQVHPYWGPYRQCATGFATDPEVRFRASSGGALSALLIHALRSGLVDRVIHIVADPDHPTRNLVACSTSEAQILEGAGSRYSSSSPLADIDHQLGLGGALVFVGKPCDVSALRRLALVDDRVGRHVPVALSFFCAGIPSHNAAGRVLDALGVEREAVAAFRYRGNGWPGLATAVLKDGREAQMSYEDSWGDILSKEVQFRCKICPDGVGGAADVAMGDAWFGDEAGYPLFEEGDGRSLVMVRSAAGERLVQSAIAAGDLLIEPLDIAEIDRMQPAQARRKRLVRARTLAMHATLASTMNTDGTMVSEAAAHASFREQLHNFLGTARRILAGRR